MNISHIIMSSSSWLELKVMVDSLLIFSLQLFRGIDYQCAVRFYLPLVPFRFLSVHDTEIVCMMINHLFRSVCKRYKCPLY